MSGTQHSHTIQRYREAKTDLSAALKEAQMNFDNARAQGDLGSGRSVFEALSLKRDEFMTLRSKLSEREIFVADYDVQVLGPRQVSLTIPTGHSRLTLLEQGRDIGETSGRLAIYPSTLHDWKNVPEFLETITTPTTISVLGLVQGTENMTHAWQAKFLSDKGLSLVSTADLAVAHIAYFVATFENLFGEDSRGRGYRASTADGSSLHFSRDIGLNEVIDYIDFPAHSSAAAYIATWVQGPVGKT